jgi:hypothetical protein
MSSVYYTSDLITHKLTQGRSKASELVGLTKMEELPSNGSNGNVKE